MSEENQNPIEDEARRLVEEAEGVAATVIAAEPAEIKTLGNWIQNQNQLREI